ncbi:MAG: sugar kinase [Hyphomicrobiaceae bacterium]
MAEQRAIAIGECMVELARGTDGRFGQAFGGDTFNTAVYLSRCGIATAYATALGDDPYTTGIVELAKCEGIATDLMLRRTGRMPGLYLIETSDDGERTFYYWRDRAPARELLDGDDAGAIVDAIVQARLVYVSGITLSLYSPVGLDRLADALQRARAAGAVIAMDSNYRPRGWDGDKARARGVMERFWRLATIGLPTQDDEATLWGDKDAGETIARLMGLGVGEVAVKLGAKGALVNGGDGSPTEIGVPKAITAVDTTAAGDSFNAAYLAARLEGRALREAALAGHRLAGIVVAHRGAIVPREATAMVLGG